jgi:hypothetical protein
MWARNSRWKPTANGYGLDVGLLVVGTGVDPVTSRFSDRSAGETLTPPDRRNCENTNCTENCYSTDVLRSSPDCVPFRVRVGTAWARNLSKLKLRNRRSNAPMEEAMKVRLS